MQIPRPETDPSPDYWYRYCASLPSIGEAWIAACKGDGKTGGDPVLLKDTQGTSLTASKSLAGSIVLSRQIARLSPEQNIGILLPSSIASVLCNAACMLLGKTAVNLNFTASAEALRSSLEQAEIRTIYTSARFLERLKARGVETGDLHDKYRIVLLEDLRKATATPRKLFILLSCKALPAKTLCKRYCTPCDPQQTAFIVFSSGSEGQPKGVRLSHQNILSNVMQSSYLFNFKQDDVVLASLPPFHSFGLTVTYFLPLLERVPVLCHADPTDVHATAKAIARHKASVMFGTSSFYHLYVRNPKVTAEDLSSLTLVIAGAEKLQEDVRRAFKAKFGIHIYEGYGVTETSPVASCNLPEDKRPRHRQEGDINKDGSVGLPLPGTTYRIADPDTFELLPPGTPGMVLISGPQVMQGYLKKEAQTHEVIRMVDGERCYVTGDKGYLDEEGFLFIQDRYSRFAKIGGEMVGLGSVETRIRQAANDPELDVLVVSLPDKRKGEKLVALTTIELDPAAMREKLMAGGLNSLALPAYWFTVEAIPKLGSGKTDFAAAKQLASQLVDAVIVY